MAITQNFLEITTAIGCPVQCLKYCPQEILVKRYSGPRKLSFSDFEKIISTVPAEVAIRFGGFSEPFVNSDAAKMILAADEAGHKIHLLTTMVGATRQDIASLNHVPFEHILLHLPDPYSNANIPVTREYLEKFREMITMHDCHFIAMNAKFPTNHHEDVARGHITRNNWYPVTCDMLQYRQVEVLPNGDVYPCCMDWELESKIGNLLVGTWQGLPRARRSQICRKCNYAMFHPVYYIHRIGTKYFHGDRS